MSSLADKRSVLLDVATKEIDRIISNLECLEEREWTYVEIRNSVREQIKCTGERLIVCMDTFYPEPTQEQLKENYDSWHPVHTCEVCKCNVVDQRPFDGKYYCVECWKAQKGVLWFDHVSDSVTPIGGPEA